MFYSQFILAKKGPLGTIWIAAHLERKLRKNQVADTDIGDSVDSILSPEVPIALRLSSHLLLGVVRIYSRKVNYLFDDCSEALLKVKQAFRSTAVDLPPEESRAPYHSITLPETFDLDDFELPDNDIFQGNYVDHHISSREQITLQDTMEGTGYTASKFGLDERFGDGDASGLDLEEELFLDKIGTSGYANESADALASARPMIPIEQDERHEDGTANTETMFGVNEDADLMDCAQAPCTPGLVEEPNLSKVQEASACDEHIESDHIIECTIKDNLDNSTCGNKQEVEWGLPDYTVSDAVNQMPPEENGYHSDCLETKQLKLQRDSSPIEETVAHSLSEDPSSVSGPPSDLADQVKPINPASKLADKIIAASDVPGEEDLQNGVVNNIKINYLTPDAPPEDCQGFNEIGFEESACNISGFTGSTPESASAKQAASFEEHVPNNVEIASDLEKCHPSEFAAELGAQNQEMASNETHFLWPCNSSLEQPGITNSRCDNSLDPNFQSDFSALGSLETSFREETAMQGELRHATDDSEQISKQDQNKEFASCEDIHAELSKPESQVDAVIIEEGEVENINNFAEPQLPAPETLLSVPAGHTDLTRSMLLEVTPMDLEGLTEDTSGSKIISGRKRSFTESTVTDQTLNSVETSKIGLAKTTRESIPDDDDLLSSILVGRRSSVFKVKPTPLSEMTSVKRTRSAPRSGASKRKVLMDDTMVLHGDTIRQQLTNTEDIRRLRKKVPCTRPEISMIQGQYLEDEVFFEPILTGMPIELASLHRQVYDLREIRICKVDVNGASLETVTEPNLTSKSNTNDAFLDIVTELKLTSQNDECFLNLDMKKHTECNAPNVAEESGIGGSSKPMVVRENGEAEPNGTPVLSENMLEEGYCPNLDVIISQQQMRPSNDGAEPNMSQREILQDVTEVETNHESLIVDAVTPSISVGVESCTNNHISSDVGDASAVPTASPSGIGNDPPEVLPDQKMDTLPFELHSSVMNAIDGHVNGPNQVTERDRDLNTECGTEAGAIDRALLEVPQCGAAVETNHGEVGPNIHSEIFHCAFDVQPTVDYPYPAEASVRMQDGSLIDGENSSWPETYHPNTKDAEISGIEPNDHDELNYVITGNDTEFLNVDDDDEVAETDDICMVETEEARFIENSGWSSRTKAVSKYLQTVFVKETECGRQSLSVDNLLVGKTRKEASRMFFETLVLKTRDYIHVEQANPFDSIAIKPRMKLMKADI